MSDDTLRRQVIAAIVMIAPDLDARALEIEPDADLHDDLGLDSMDLVNVAAALAASTGVDIPERDYPGLRTISELTVYLVTHPSSAPGDSGG